MVMSDVRQVEMQGLHHDHAAERPEFGSEFLRFAVARSRPQVELNDKSSIARAVEFEVVPRLVLAHQRKGAKSGLPSAPLGRNFSNEVRGFADMVLGRSEDAAGAHIQSLQEQKIPLEAIYLNLMAPAAR